jgi:hypothetical protein
MSNEEGHNQQEIGRFFMINRVDSNSNKKTKNSTSPSSDNNNDVIAKDTYYATCTDLSIRKHRIHSASR